MEKIDASLIHFFMSVMLTTMLAIFLAKYAESKYDKISALVITCIFCMVSVIYSSIGFGKRDAFVLNIQAVIESHPLALSFVVIFMVASLVTAVYSFFADELSKKAKIDEKPSLKEKIIKLIKNPKQIYCYMSVFFLIVSLVIFDATKLFS